MPTKINVNGKYPCCANWVVMKRTRDGVIAKNCLIDETIKLSDREARYLTRLNGNRNPYRMKEFSVDECTSYFRFLKECMLVREAGRSMYIDEMKLYTLIIPNKTRTNSVIPRILNFLLCILFLPVFAYGLYCIFAYENTWGMEDPTILNILLGSIGGIFLGTILHEFAHAFSCLSDENGRVFEAGVMLNGMFLAEYAYRLFKENYNWSKTIRSIGIRGADLVTDKYWEQIDLFDDISRREKMMKADAAVDDIRRRFGYYSVQRGLMYMDSHLSRINAKEDHTVHPHGYFG